MADGAAPLQREVTAELLGSTPPVTYSSPGSIAGPVAPAGSVAAGPSVPSQGGRNGAADPWRGPAGAGTEDAAASSAAAGIDAPPAAGQAAPATSSTDPARRPGLDSGAALVAPVQRQAADSPGPAPPSPAGTFPLLGDRPTTPTVAPSPASGAAAAGALAAPAVGPSAGSQPVASPLPAGGSAGSLVVAGPVVSRLPAVPLLGAAEPAPALQRASDLLPHPSARPPGPGLPARSDRAPAGLPGPPGSAGRPPALALLPDAGAVAVAAGLADRGPDGAVVFRQVADATPASVATEAGPSTVPSPPAAPVQRADSAPAAPDLPDATAGLAAGAAAVDELVRRLYEPLSARIKAELRLDRERAGMLTDLRR